MVRVQQMKKAAGALSIDDVISSDITISRKIYQQRASTSRGNLELAIAKRCRLHKLIRQHFAFALKIQQMLFALISNSRKIPAGSYIVGKSSRKLFMTNDWTISCKHIVTTSWTSRRKKFFIQSRATVDPVEGYSALHIQSTKNSAEAQSSSRHESAAKQLTIYEELSKLDVNC
ncbi:clathrin assembly protein [Dorcoceras hygrometricum]|uniref:Clathrin assembly protein n=1 Tax=Dorcoceras hygrometricum TaxID=472368 RepID=A0A2Z7BTZ5_9LAMI|nr:clathrin assembly protein [Dorcoceras hygrometricum]